MKTYSLLMAAVLTVVMVSSCPIGGFAPPSHYDTGLILMAEGPQAVEIINPNIHSESRASRYIIHATGFYRYVSSSGGTVRSGIFPQYVTDIPNFITSALFDRLTNRGSAPIYVFVHPDTWINRYVDRNFDYVAYEESLIILENIEKFQELKALELFESEIPNRDDLPEIWFSPTDSPRIEGGSVLNNYMNIYYNTSDGVPLSEKIRLYREKYVELFCEGEILNCDYITVIQPGETKFIAPQILLDRFTR